ncbi:nitrous oxide-stimulated promoter family protein [Shewanella glacialimarina]|uniref:nitrous oxide-stimulated promoter family protein n=1 Tax=Shewanella glacialimarina TaxID=2590884 RepID=UPI001CF7FC1B|nr:nitrous oxide-stimulated promoter family protein [Shewanella glacialimarina]UCX03358.1 nitrous oxide-stimulated promoter family protein [Shewanella glacialimarina]
MAVSELLSGKLLYEFRTMTAMVEIYCKAHHPMKPDHGACHSCSDFLAYADTRLDRCPYGQAKPTCNKCPVHCYKPQMKQKAREIMIFAGPRMLIPHPIMAIKHLLAERKPGPGKPPEGVSNRHQRKLG